MAPSLSPDSQKILRILLQQSAMSGEQLSLFAELDANALYKAIQELLSAKVISANQPLFSPEQVYKTYFNLNPSARRFAEFASRS